MLSEQFLEMNETWMEFQASLPSRVHVLLCLEPGPRRDPLEQGCREAGWQVATADTAAEAAEALNRREVDLLVVAEDPPDMTALNLLRFARGKPMTPTAILLAQNPTPRKILESIQLGKNDYLLEPEQRADELMERIRARMDQLCRQKLQLRMLSDLRRLHQEASPELRQSLIEQLQSHLEAHRAAVGPMNRVLVAAPDPQTRSPMLSTLSGMGLVAAEAADGRQVIEQLESDGADLVLVSSHLPDFTLSEMQVQVRRIAPTLPLLLLADIRDSESVLTALRLGFVDGIRTPIASPEAAGHRVTRLLKERRRELLAEQLIRELYRLVRGAHAHATVEAKARVEEVFDHVVLPEAAPTEGAAPTSPPSAPAEPGATTPGGELARDEAAVQVGAGADSLDAGAPDAPGAAEETSVLQLSSQEVQVIAQGNRPDVMEASHLPDTVVLSYIDDLLFPDASKHLPGAMGAGQRLTPRVERATFVRYGPTGTEKAALGYAHDLSLGGMFILSDNPPPVGTDLQIALQIPHQDQIEHVRVQGRVMWHTDEERRPPQGDGFGVQFTVVSSAASAALLRAVTEA